MPGINLRLTRFAARALASGAIVLALGVPATASPDCPADLNGDGSVGSADLALLLGSWGGPGPADLDASGAVGSADLALLLGSWGPCPPVARLIEPGTMHSPPGAPEFPSFGHGRPRQSWIDDWSREGLYYFSGEFICSHIDVQVSGRGVDFLWGRKYRSRIGAESDLGHGWDFSYNQRVFLEAGGIVVVLDGYSRADRYMPQPDGTWTAPEFFRTLSQNPDGSYTLLFQHGGKWNFRALDGSPGAGKIASIEDRNGNALTFVYDAAGRLTVVRDTITVLFNPREYTITRNAAGNIAAITDFTGRQVRYEYYSGEPGGSPGDLKSVTTPSVVGTPNGNDFPLGKTTTYTYTTGFADDRLNHNLLTITDPKGQTWLVNHYDPTTNPANPNFDRCTRQTIGPSGHTIDYVYLAQTPGPGNNGASMRTIVRDRMGNVGEYFYDSANRMVMRRDFTGRANPDQPTTDTLNRPMGKLRSTDPDYFESRWQWTPDALCARTDYPNGRFQTFVYESAAADRRAQGNLLEVTANPGPLGGDQPERTLSWEYTPPPGMLAHNFPTRATDARANSTFYQYDPRGNVVHITHRIPSIVEDLEYNAFGQATARILPDNGSGHRRRDQFEYYEPADGAQNGQLARLIMDQGPAPAAGNLTSEFEYDALGRIVRMLDPTGADWLYTYNELDQIVRELSRPVSSLPPIVRYETLRFFDLNGDITRVDVENRDANGVLDPNTHFSTRYEYDPLDRLIRVLDERDPAHDVVTEFEYDANGDRTLVRCGAATSGVDPFNTITTAWDERRLRFREWLALGSGDQTSSRADYTATGLLAQLTTGVEDPVSPRVQSFVYSGYDEIIKTTDAMGNMTIVHYDQNSNSVSRRIEGELIDAPGFGANVRLAETMHQYDAMDRLIRADVAHFETDTQAPIGDGFQTTQWAYNGLGGVITETDDLARSTHVEYNRLLRPALTTAPDGGAVAFTYDAKLNVIQVDQADLSTAGLSPQSFRTMYQYDGLDRLVRTIDSSGNEWSVGYDSRSNIARETDPLGHVTRSTYDGLCRRIILEADLDGDGVPSPLDITTTQSWDDSSRLVSTTDDNGNTTQYDYNSRNIPIRYTLADSTEDVCTIDVHGNVVSSTDANGTAAQHTYDQANRRKQSLYFPAAGVSPQTSVENYEYDGLSRLVHAQNNGAVVDRIFSSISNVLREMQNGALVQYTYDSLGNRISCAYPSGRTLTCTYDPFLDRPIAVADAAGLVAAAQWIGGRPTRIDLGNGAHTDLTWDGVQGVPNPPGDHGDRQVVQSIHSTPVFPGVIDARTYGWDPAQKKDIMGRASIPGLPGQPPLPSLTRTMEYDRADRMTRATIQQDAVITRTTNYTLDGPGNRVQTSGPGTPCAGPYTMSPVLPEPADRQVNQYTNLPCEVRQYDRNGNLRSRDAAAGIHHLLTYDVHDRLVEVKDSATLQRIAVYEYDAMGRRIRKTLDPDGPAATSTDYRYDGADVIEEQTGGLPLRTFAMWPHMHKLGRLVSMSDGASEHYFHSDDLGSVIAITNDVGEVVERCEYDDFGVPSLTDAAGASIPQSLVHNPYLFHAMRIDEEARLYLDGDAHMDPRAGRYANGPRCICKPGWAGPQCRTAQAASTFSDNNPWSGRMPGKISLCKREGTVIEWTFEKGWPCRYEGPRIDSAVVGHCITSPRDTHSGASTGRAYSYHHSLGTCEWEDIVLTGQVTRERKDMLQWYADMSASGADAYRAYRPGRPTFGNITFEGAEHPEGGTSRGKNIRKNITVTLFKSDKSHSARHHSLGTHEWEDITLQGPLTRNRKYMLQWYMDTYAVAGGHGAGGGGGGGATWHVIPVPTPGGGGGGTGGGLPGGPVLNDSHIPSSNGNEPGTANPVIIGSGGHPPVSSWPSVVIIGPHPP